jgi:DnaJ-class molecular chaperone
MFDYRRSDWEYRQHHVRFVRYVESRRLSCMDCHGRGGETMPILDFGQGPWEECGWCEGTGYMTPHGRGEWLRFKREEKRCA